jgi:hypothetical protein
LDNSTLPQPEPIYDRVVSLFSSAQLESFEPGIESNFSKNLTWLIQENWSETIDALASIIEHSQVSDEIGSEALRLLGRVNHFASYGMRFWLLRHFLFSNSPEIRDAASLGLASLDDPDAISDLKTAIDREGVADLRQDLEQVLTQLECTSVCRESS